MAVVESELKVLKMVGELKSKGCALTIARRLRFYPDYVDMLLRSLAKSGFITKAGRVTYKLTYAGRSVLEGPPEAPEAKKAPKKGKKK
ncbi:MAG: hypothetical protein AB1393_02205 [Candidatus Edwardsbacteria bacterium]